MKLGLQSVNMWTAGPCRTLWHQPLCLICLASRSSLLHSSLSHEHVYRDGLRRCGSCTWWYAPDKDSKRAGPPGRKGPLWCLLRHLLPRRASRVPPPFQRVDVLVTSLLEGLCGHAPLLAAHLPFLYSPGVRSTSYAAQKPARPDINQRQSKALATKPEVPSAGFKRQQLLTAHAYVEHAPCHQLRQQAPQRC